MIIFYSSNCPKCKILKSLMDKKNVAYTLVDDEQEYIQIADKFNIMSMPFASVDNEIMNTNEFEKYLFKKYLMAQ